MKDVQIVEKYFIHQAGYILDGTRLLSHGFVYKIISFCLTRFSPKSVPLLFLKSTATLFSITHSPSLPLPLPTILLTITVLHNNTALRTLQVVFDRRSPTLLRATRHSGSLVTFDTYIRKARKEIGCAALSVSTDVPVTVTESYPDSGNSIEGDLPQLDAVSPGMFSAFFGENLLLYRPYVLSMYRVVSRFNPQRSQNRVASNLKSVNMYLLENHSSHSSLPLSVSTLHLTLRYSDIVCHGCSCF